MNTTAAAIQANVTTDTIRTWCRIGAVAATKQAGRWIIDTASLAARIAIGAMKTRKAPKPVVYSIDTITAIGGRRWQKNGMDRVYINDWEQFAGVEVTRYGTSNISGASIGGRPIANGRAGQVLNSVSKVYFDTADNQVHVQHYDAHRFEIRYLDGERDTVNLVQNIFDGIRAAIAAL
jgi:hypothetical protein